MELKFIFTLSTQLSILRPRLAFDDAASSVIERRWKICTSSVACVPGSKPNYQSITFTYFFMSSSCSAKSTLYPIHLPSFAHNLPMYRSERRSSDKEKVSWDPWFKRLMFDGTLHHHSKIYFSSSSPCLNFFPNTNAQQKKGSEAQNKRWWWCLCSEEPSHYSLLDKPAFPSLCPHLMLALFCYRGKKCEQMKKYANRSAFLFNFHRMLPVPPIISLLCSRLLRGLLILMPSINVKCSYV